MCKGFFITRITSIREIIMNDIEISVHNVAVGEFISLINYIYLVLLSRYSLMLVILYKCSLKW